MGMGDEIMAAGQARWWHHYSGGRVRITDRHHRGRWHELWENLPYIVRPDEYQVSCTEIQNCSGARPYIKYPFTHETGCTFSDWKAADHPGEIILSTEELLTVEHFKDVFGDFVLIEPSPTIKNPNRRWFRERWQVVADATDRDVHWVQPQHRDTRPLQGVVQCATPRGLRELAALVYASQGVVAVEGGLAHMAAALGKPAVVLWGGCTSAANLSYPTHVNIVDGGPGSPCGRWTPCRHCDDVWQGLSVKVVIDHVLETFGPHGTVQGLAGGS